MVEEPPCLGCNSVQHVVPVVVGSRGEYGLIGWKCLDCDIVMDEHANGVWVYDG